MSGSFSITVDPARDFVEITMAGFFTTTDVADFREAQHRAYRQLLCDPNQHVTLNDVSALKVQSQEIVAAFAALLASPDYASRRLAFVVSPTLARTQVMRALAGRDARCFASRVHAKAWLFAADRAIAA